MKIKWIALSLSLLLFCLCFASCINSVYYENADAYNVGGAESIDGFENLSIDWSSGKVNVIFADVDAVSIREESKTELTDEMQMRWLVEDGTLFIRFSAVGLFTAARLSNVSKTLTVTLPLNFALSAVRIAVASADLHTDTFSAEKIEIAGASGDFDVSILACESVKLSNASGHIKAKIDDSPSIELSNSSGTIDAEVGSCDTLTASSSSGGVNLEVEKVGILNAESSSGSIHADVNAVNTADISASSGSIFLNLPEALDFTLKESTGSGHFDCDFPLVTQNHEHVHGEGMTKINLSTSSGNIVVRKK